ncbi:uncharacterized protein LOC115477785 [Microcaecilia unicolor]|uniref:Uncharacterized protein LOC115477785 n=1 Tax=Microcaecilia unicolor TaxID=1415580 RepID=A0A6P7Z5J2_9AMPH|nr:uncharacterized protein LOC115477785 [Microcaecilia unicolor]
MMKGDMEDPKLSQVPPSNEDLQMSPFADCKCNAPSLLYEVEKLLDVFSQYETNFPQGLVNVLNQSWTELTEGAVYPKKYWQAPVGRGMKVGAQERSNKPAAPEVTVTKKVEKVKSKKNKKCVRLAENVKEKRNREAAPNKPPGNRVPVTQPHVYETISFSMSSRMCEEQGWIFQNRDPESEEKEWKAVYRWAVERLQLAQIPINKQLSDLKEKGFDKPVLLRHYDDSKQEVVKPKKQACESSASLGLHNGKPLVPEMKKKDPVLKKLHYALIDGSSLT